MAPTYEAAAAKLRIDIQLPGALRWFRRRVALVHAALSALIGLLPDCFAGCDPTLLSFAAALPDVPCVLVALREKSEAFLRRLPPPLGFGPRPARRWHRPRSFQQDSGPDPPDHLR